MTSPKGSLHPASSDDAGTLLGALELVAGHRVQLAQIEKWLDKSEQRDKWKLSRIWPD